MEIKGICPIAPAVYNANGEVDCQEYHDLAHCLPRHKEILENLSLEG